MTGTCSWCKRPLPPRRRRFCTDDCRRRGQKAERKTENDDYARPVVRQIRSMGVRASADLDALAWLADAADHARTALALAVDGCRTRGYSDAAIGAAPGITRRAVWKRFPRQPKVDAEATGTAGAGDDEGQPETSDLDWVEAVRQAFADRTGQGITREQALAVAAKVIGSQPVRRPGPYVTTAIKRDVDPLRLLPGGRTGTPEDAAVLGWLRTVGSPA